MEVKLRSIYNNSETLCFSSNHLPVYGWNDFNK